MKFLKIGLVTAVMTSATLFVAPAIADDVPVDTPTCVEVGYTQVTDWTTGPAPGPDWVLDQTRTKEGTGLDAWTETVEGTPDTRVWWNFDVKGWDGGPPPADHPGWHAHGNMPNDNSQHSYPGPNGLGVPYQPGNGGDNGRENWFRFTGTPGTPDTYIEHPAIPKVLEYTYTRFIGSVKCTEPPVDECANGGCEHEQPEPGSDPEKFTLTDTTKETKCKPKKCVVIVTDSTGKVVDKSEIVYGNVDEEGF